MSVDIDKLRQLLAAIEPNPADERGEARGIGPRELMCWQVPTLLDELETHRSEDKQQARLQDIAEAQKEIERLWSLCEAAADEIEEYIDAHTDDEGAGPANLLAGLRGRTSPHYGNSADQALVETAIRRAESAEAELEEVRADVERLEKVANGRGWRCKKCGHAWGHGARVAAECHACLNLRRAQDSEAALAKANEEIKDLEAAASESVEEHRKWCNAHEINRRGAVQAALAKEQQAHKETEESLSIAHDFHTIAVKERDRANDNLYAEQQAHAETRRGLERWKHSSINADD